MMVLQNTKNLLKNTCMTQADEIFKKTNVQDIDDNGGVSGASSPGLGSPMIMQSSNSLKN